MEVKTFEVGSFGTNMYLVSAAGGLLLIDPACATPYEQQMLLRALPVFPPLRGDRGGLGGREGQLLILATHGHLDHLWGAAWACRQWNTSVLMHEADIPMAQAMQAQYDLFGVGGTPEPFPIEPLPVNQSVSEAVCQCNGLSATRSVSPQGGLSVLLTPGHTPGSVCFYFPEDGVLFSGDTLFRMGYGRTDLPGGDIRQLWHSLDLLLALPPETVVYPGHGAPTTIAAERARW